MSTASKNPPLIKAVKRYMTPDGSLFSRRADAKRHCEETWAEHPIGFGGVWSLERGAYVKRSKRSCIEAKRRIVAISRKYLSRKRHPALWEDEPHVMKVLMSVMGDENRSGSLLLLWMRLASIDWKTFREYASPHESNA